jgi:hypothetical protein
MRSISICPAKESPAREQRIEAHDGAGSVAQAVKVIVTATLHPGFGLHVEHWTVRAT